MSRTVNIKQVRITSISALEKAVAELKNGGLQCELVSNAKPRLWGGDSNAPVCAKVLKLPGRFDVGFQQQKDGSYNMLVDLHGGEVKAHVGAKCDVKGATYEELGVGRLAQLYSKHLALEAAMAAGYPVSSVKVGTDGSIIIEADVVAMQA